METHTVFDTAQPHVLTLVAVLPTTSSCFGHAMR